MGSGGLITHGTDRLQRSRQFLSSPSHPLRMAGPRTTLLFLVYPRAQAVDADLTMPSILSSFSRLSFLPLSPSYPSFALREYSLLSLIAGSLAVAELASFASIIVILSDYHAHSSQLTHIVEIVNIIIYVLPWTKCVIVKIFFLIAYI